MHRRGLRRIAAAMLAAGLAAGAFAPHAHAQAQTQAALAPWFDADGFYHRAGVDLERATNDLAVCRAEAARLKTVRNTRTPVGSAMAFNADGSYNPAISGAATGIASIMFAIQDARYNGSIEQIEFRDCAIALGFRHYRLSQRDRARFDSQADRGFASLVTGITPPAGELNESEPERNYFADNLAARPYRLPPRRSAGAPAEPPPNGGGPEAALTPLAEPPPAPPPAQAFAGVIARAAPGEVLTAEPGMAIVVASARQQSGSLQIPVPGDTIRFKRVTAEGRFADLLQPTASFAVRSHFKPERRRDPTLAGDFDAPRYSTYRIPAGRYVLSDVGALNACLGTLTFEVVEGEVVYLGDFVVRAPGLPTGSLFNPLGNINSGMDNNLRDDLRVAIGDDLEGARQALQADADMKARLDRVVYDHGYRIPCDGRYIGLIANYNWGFFDPRQAMHFHDAVAASVAPVNPGSGSDGSQD